MNKTLVKVLKKIVEANKKVWDWKLNSALWAFWTSYKVAPTMTHFKMTYELQDIVPMKLLVKCSRLAVQEKLTMEEYKEQRIQELLKL